MKSKDEIRRQLALRSDRLGYWCTPHRNQGIFYCLGEEGATTRKYSLAGGRIAQRPTDRSPAPDLEKAAQLYSLYTRFRYIPWFLRSPFLAFCCVSGFLLILGLFIVSFAPRTAITTKGLRPLVSVLPNAGGFSPANFVYSLVPSTIGMLLYLCYQPLDMAVRRLQPWAELARAAGATVENSLLLDYTAATPISCLLSAVAAEHWRVASTALLSLLLILLPVLAGGLFFPLAVSDQSVRMIASLPAYYLILGLLLLYLLSLCSLLPGRRRMHLPHDVGCLAEVISFLYGSGCVTDVQFARPKSKADLQTRLLAPRLRGQRNRYAFGVIRGREGGECFGIERVGRRGGKEVMVLSG